ncbi:Uncharacterised protein [Mycobacterium tuberculosis]|nr:Uncharacterised protein [Mycobacterium tuberculosis]
MKKAIKKVFLHLLWKKEWKDLLQVLKWINSECVHLKQDLYSLITVESTKIN